jgi:hypothetical protein
MNHRLSDPLPNQASEEHLTCSQFLASKVKIAVNICVKIMWNMCFYLFRKFIENPDYLPENKCKFNVFM